MRIEALHLAQRLRLIRQIALLLRIVAQVVQRDVAVLVAAQLPLVGDDHQAEFRRAEDVIARSGLGQTQLRQHDRITPARSIHARQRENRRRHIGERDE